MIWSLTILPMPSIGQDQGADALEKNTARTPSFLIGLPPGKDREMVIAQCIRCHSPRLIGAQAMRRDQWKETIDSMQKHGFLPMPEPIEKRVLDYLETYCGPDKKRVSAVDGLTSPWATPLYRPNPIWD